MTYQVVVYDTKGKKLSTKDLDANLYNTDVINSDLIHEYFLLQQSNARIAIAHTKTRGEVHGSGRKLFSQKGGGRARAGDKKSPIRKGGGVVFGPRKDRNFSKKMPQKMRRRALRGVVSLKAGEKSLLGVKGLTFDVPKTKDAVSLLQNLECRNQRVLIVGSESSNNVQKSFGNLVKVRYIDMKYLNPVDILWAQKIVMSDDVIEYLNTLV